MAEIRGRDAFREALFDKRPPMIRTVALRDQTQVPALGQGTWRMGEEAARRHQEIAALRAGVEHGMILIDTAEMYGDGATETLLGEALAGLRDKVFLISKAYPQNAGRGRLERACEASLRRLRPTTSISTCCTGEDRSHSPRRRKAWTR